MTEDFVPQDYDHTCPGYPDSCSNCQYSQCERCGTRMCMKLGYIYEEEEMEETTTTRVNFEEFEALPDEFFEEKMRRGFMLMFVNASDLDCITVGVDSTEQIREAIRKLNNLLPE